MHDGSPCVFLVDQPERRETQKPEKPLLENGHSLTHPFEHRDGTEGGRRGSMGRRRSPSVQPQCCDVQTPSPTPSPPTPHPTLHLSCVFFPTILHTRFFRSYENCNSALAHTRQLTMQCVFTHSRGNPMKGFMANPAWTAPPYLSSVPSSLEFHVGSAPNPHAIVIFPPCTHAHSPAHPRRLSCSMRTLCGDFPHQLWAPTASPRLAVAMISRYLQSCVGCVTVCATQRRHVRDDKLFRIRHLP